MKLPSIPSVPSVKDALSNLNPLDKLAASLPDLPLPALESMLADFASAFTQEARLISLQLGDGSAYANRLLPQSVEGREALSAPYRYALTCLSPDAFIPLDGLLGLDAQIDILTSGTALGLGAGSGHLTRCGLVTEAQALPSDGGFARYRLIIEPPLALLRHRTASRVFQDISVPEIVQQLLDEHIAANTAIGATLKFEFDLAKHYPPRSYCLQYRETDLEFIERLLFEEGICYRWAHSSGDVASVSFIAFDDPYHLPQAGQGTVRFHRMDATEPEDSLTEWTQARRIGPSRASLTSYDYKPARTLEAAWDSAWEERYGAQGRDLPAEAGLEDFEAKTLYYGSDASELHRYGALRQEAHDRMKGGYRAAGNLRELMAGEWFQLADHPAFERLPVEEREFAACALEFTAPNNLPQSLSKRLAPAAGQDSPPPYWVKLSARRRGLPLTPAYAHTIHAKPTAHGPQTATVTGPQGEELYTDEMGRIKIQFHWQRQKEHPEFGASFDERSSCWVRVATPSAGAAWGTQHIPRIGQEVLVEFIEADIDRPLVTAAIHNGAQANPWFSEAGSLPANRALSGVKSKEHHGQKYGELLFDDTTGQVRTKLSSEHGKTQLNQGYLTHPRRDGEAKPRGEGFELRTDCHGALRAAQGMLISTEPSPDATGRQLDRDAARGQLEAALGAAQALSEAAGNQKADAVETGPQERDEEGSKLDKAPKGHLEHMLGAIREWEEGSNTGLEGKNDAGQPGRQPVLLLSGAEGIGLATPSEMVLASGANLDTVSQRDTQQTSLRRWIHNAGKKISLFVLGVRDKVNLKLITAKGHAQLYAQSGDVEIAGDQSLRLYGSKKKLIAAAGEELLLNCGGATIRLKGGNIDIHCPGNLSMKAAKFDMSGPARMDIDMPQFPDSSLDFNLEDDFPLSR
jgi:type VI secretion system secreted protein VgrG